MALAFGDKPQRPPPLEIIAGTQLAVPKLGVGFGHPALVGDVLSYGSKKREEVDNRFWRWLRPGKVRAQLASGSTGMPGSSTAASMAGLA